tara:strand:- start:5474 stop:5950 length:477 start_codon:yes stop_codon:yes gene_type:complete
MAIYFPNNTITEVGASKLLFPKNIVQVVESRITATFTVNNWATQNEIGTVSITPTSATSQILVYVNIGFRADFNTTWSLGYFWLRNNTRNVELTRSGWNGTWRSVIYDWSKQYLDSPASTATQTYSLRCGNYPSGTHAFNTQLASDQICIIRATEFAV